MFPLILTIISSLQKRSFRTALCLTVLALLPLSLSCARLPPNQHTLSGRRIRVKMTFGGDMQSSFFYFFLINRVGPQGNLGYIGRAWPRSCA